VRSNDHITHLLIGVAGIYAQAHVHFYGAIELEIEVSLTSFTASSGSPVIWFYFGRGGQVFLSCLAIFLSFVVLAALKTTP